MRILQISQRPQRRGAEVFAHQLSAELRRRGHDVAIAYLYPYGDCNLPLGSDDRVLDGETSHPSETLIGVHPALLRRLHRMVDEFRPDITQVNGARTVKYGTLVHRLWKGSAGAVVYRNIGSSRDWVRGMRRKLFYRAILRRVDGVVAISRDSAEALRPAFHSGTPLTVISNAIDPASLRPAVSREWLRASAATPAAARVVLFVGSLAREKRVDRLIEAVRVARRRVSDLHLWIVGDGPLRRSLERQVEAAGMSDVARFFGTRDDVASYLAAADMVALVSDTEGVPSVVLEAGYLGLAVIATRVGGVAECVLDEETGLLVPPGDHDALVTALTCLADDAELRHKLGQRAREWVAAHHTMERIAPQYLDFYRQVCGRATAQQGPASRPQREARRPPKVAATRNNGAEMEVLLACGRSRLRAADVERIRHLLQAPLDWQRLLDMAGRHKMFPLLATHLRGFAEGIPEDVLAELSAWEVDNACRMLEITRELLRILREFREHGIEVVPYKGPVLALQSYGTVALRQAGDLDLVVRRRDVDRARGLLRAAGYRPCHSLPEASATFVLRSRYGETLRRSDGLSVELHWAFTNRDVSFPLSLDDLMPGLQSVQLGGESVPVVGLEDSLILLSVHGAKHRWERLEWICGVAELVGSAENVDWEALVARASSLGVRRMLLLGLLLSHDLLDAEVPVSVLRRARGDRAVADLAGQVPTILMEPPTEADALSLPVDLFRLRLRERWRDRLRFIVYRLTTPSRPQEWAVVGVGSRVIPVHALMRPFQLLSRVIPAARWYLASRWRGRRG